MIVYGDQPRCEAPAAKLAALAEALCQLGGLPPGLARHAALVGALIEAGELAQGLADADFAERGQDATSSRADAAMALLADLARGVWASWTSGFTAAMPLSQERIRALEATALPSRIESKRAEGFAFYALYPEAYAEAALALPAKEPLRVIGLRSIGTTLAAMVAAARGAPVPHTLRPVGHPFQRDVAVEDKLASAILSGPCTQYAVVDEGPGLSGSSFGAAMAFLQDGGVPLERIHLLPGHGGEPGPQAPARDQARWARVARHPASFDRLLLDTPRAEHRLEAWAAALLGPATQPMEEISAGAWRAHRFPDAAEWPPIHPFLERRKFLFHSGSGTWLLKFVGLGAAGEATAARARQLHAAGFTPEVAGLLHGFLVERWMDQAKPLEPAKADRATLLAQIRRYLALRARDMPAPPGSGASAQSLWAMARTNTAEALGESAAARLECWEPKLPQLEAGMRRCWTDNRMHRWEWLALPGGRLLKADAVDHAAAHDLVGCQDIAWDVAGAVVELGLTEEEGHTLLAALGREAPLLAFLRPCYLAFQLGYHRMAADAFGWNPTEAGRARAAADRYAERLETALIRA